MRWMVDARNKIEKQGELEAHSFVRAEIMASYYEEGPRIEVPAELFQSPTELISSVTHLLPKSGQTWRTNEQCSMRSQSVLARRVAASLNRGILQYRFQM
jgi:hypothetical protein